MSWHTPDITLRNILRFWARNGMVTRVVAKQAKTTKTKTILLMEKTSKEYSVVFLVEGEKFNLSEKI